MSAASTCAWCPEAIPSSARRDSVYCSQRCRQTAFRLRRRRATDASLVGAHRFAYADPPYPDTCARYYKHEATYGGEVDHAALVASLEAGGYLGWALSTSARALRDVLPLCPRGARVCPWVKPLVAPQKTRGLHNRWEPLIVVGGRELQPGVRDWLLAAPARFGGELMGRKPIAFCAWLFDALGMLPGDTLDDVFPGTGVVGRAWSDLSRRSSATGRAWQASLLEDCDASPGAAGHASSLQEHDASLVDDVRRLAHSLAG